MCLRAAIVVSVACVKREGERKIGDGYWRLAFLVNVRQSFAVKNHRSQFLDKERDTSDVLKICTILCTCKMFVRTRPHSALLLLKNIFSKIWQGRIVNV